jgi:hypothetical protein
LWALGLVFVWSVMLFFVAGTFSQSKPIGFLCWIGGNITVFFVIQWLIIGNIATAIYQTKSIDSFWYYFLGILSVTVVLTFLYQKAMPRLILIVSKMKLF